jgi:phage terminase small subunit
VNPKHQQFVNEYLKCWNATEAYRRVYPTSSDDAARAHAARLVANGSVAEAIQQRIAENAMSADEVLSRLAEHARGDIGDLLDDDGGIDWGKARESGKTRLVKKVTVRTVTTEESTIETEAIELYDAQSALVQIGKHHKLFVDRTENKTDHTLRVEYGDDGSDSETTETA